MGRLPSLSPARSSLVPLLSFVVFMLAGAAVRAPRAVAGTWQTEHGPEPIEKLKRGEKVYSRDPKTGRTEFKKILKTTVRRVGVVVRLSLTDPKSGKAEQITATLEHPFWVKGRGFVKAGELGIGTEIVTRAGPSLVVKSTRRIHPTGGYLVYNAVVEDDHTYFVGNTDGGAWVHNVDLCGEARDQIANKLNFLLGKAGGNQHNIDRTNEMYLSLRNIGLSDTPEIRAYLQSHFESVASDDSNIIGATRFGNLRRESLLFGPMGAVRVESTWKGQFMASVNVFPGRR